MPFFRRDIEPVTYRGGNPWGMQSVQPVAPVAPVSQPVPQPAKRGNLADFLSRFSNNTDSDYSGVAAALATVGIGSNGGRDSHGWEFIRHEVEDGLESGWQLTDEARRRLEGWTIGYDAAASTSQEQRLQVFDASGRIVGGVTQYDKPNTGLWAIGETVAQLAAVVAAAYAIPGIAGSIFGGGAAVAEGAAAAWAPLAEADAAIGAWGGLDSSALFIDGVASSVAAVPLEAAAAIESTVTAWAAPDVFALLPAFEVAAPVAAGGVVDAWAQATITPATVQAEAAAAIESTVTAWAAPSVADLLPAFEVAAPVAAGGVVDAWAQATITPATVQAEAAAAIESTVTAWAAPSVADLLPAFEVAAPVLAAPAYLWNAAADSQAASTAAGITGAQAAAAATVPVAVDLGGLGGIVSTAADAVIVAPPSLASTVAAKATTSAANAALGKALQALSGVLQQTSAAATAGAPGAAPIVAASNPLQASPGFALLLLAGLGLILS